MYDREVIERQRQTIENLSKRVNDMLVLADRLDALEGVAMRAADRLCRPPAVLKTMRRGRAVDNMYDEFLELSRELRDAVRKAKEVKL